MPTGPKGQKRPADAIGRAVHIAKIATGKIEDNTRSRAMLRSKGGEARAK